jgi:hypothetical protein
MVYLVIPAIVIGITLGLKNNRLAAILIAGGSALVLNLVL